MRQLPILSPAVYSQLARWDKSVDSLGSWVTSRVLELSYTSYDMGGFAHDLDDYGPPFVWDGARRTLMRAELDAAYFHLYGVVRDDVDYIMETFKVVRERDERAYGEYRSKRLIMEIYDAMQKAIDAGLPYQTVLDPAPGHGPRHPVQSEVSR